MDWSDSIRTMLKESLCNEKKAALFSATIAALLAPLPQYPQSITTIKQLESGPFASIYPR